MIELDTFEQYTADLQRWLEGEDEFACEEHGEFACNSKSCAPPPVGTGGSISTGSSGNHGIRLFPLDSTNAQLASAVGAALARRIERDIAAETGPVWEATWRRTHKMPADTEMLALADGDRDAIARLTKFKTERFTSSDDKEIVTAVSDALDVLQSNKPFAKAVERYGAIPVVVAKSLGNLASGRYLTDMIALSEMLSARSGKPIGELNIDDGVDGTIRHEYGHHVESLASDELVTKFVRAYSQWDGRLDSPDAVDRVIDEGQVNGRWPTYGLSVYGRTNQKEAFAEVFTLVTHPEFDRAAIDPQISEMVDVMMEIIQ